jgi:hypothetical protein
VDASTFVPVGPMLARKLSTTYAIVGFSLGASTGGTIDRHSIHFSTILRAVVQSFVLVALFEIYIPPGKVPSAEFAQSQSWRRSESVRGSYDLPLWIQDLWCPSKQFQGCHSPQSVLLGVLHGPNDHHLSCKIKYL